MQIVIDIDEDLYTRLFDNGEDEVIDMQRACAAIRDGKPLPKGHGRLTDVDALFDYFGYDALDEVTRSNIEYFIRETKGTIIEANKTESEE